MLHAAKLPLKGAHSLRNGPLSSAEMTRQHSDGREPAARDGVASNMGPPLPQPPCTPARDRAQDTAAKLERFSRSSHKIKPSSAINEELQSGAAGDVNNPPETTQQSPQDMSSQLGDGELLEASAGPTHNVDDTAQEQPTLKDVFSAISVCNATLQTLNLHIGGLKEEMVHVRQEIRQINDRVKEAENRVSTVEDQLPPMSKAIQSHAQDIAALLNKVDDLENRSRRNNVRLVGVPEKAEG